MDSGQQIVAVITSIVCLVYILSPFFVGKGGKLASASTINDPKKLEGLKKALLNQILKEEKSASDGDITAAQWERRRKLLTHRYIDVSKRLDYVSGQES